MSEPLRTERTPKRIRALVDGVVALDTRSGVLVWEHPYYPTYFVPRADVRADLVETTERTDRSVHPGLGPGLVCNLHVGARMLPRSALTFPDAATADLRDLVRVKWDAMHEWLEEDEPVYVHPRDPYKRVDVLASSRHVRLVLDGVTLAESTQPRILFETGLPPRYYLSMSDVRTELLRPSASVTRCPYKGTAAWWSVDVGGTVHDDLAWIYRTPHPESQRIAGLVAFYDERLDLYLDDELQQRPGRR